MGMIAGYLEVLAPFRRRALLCVGLVALAGLLEGMALLALIPVLQGHSGTAVSAAPGLGSHIFGSYPGQGWVARIFVFFGLGAFSAGARFASDCLLTRLRVDVEDRLRHRMSQALMDMDWSQFQGMRIGDISYAILGEAGQIAFGAHVFLNAVGTTLVALVLGGAAFLISVELTLYTAVFGVAGWGLFRLTSRWAVRHGGVVTVLASEIGDRTGSIYGNMKFFRATGLAQAALKDAFEGYRQFAGAVFFSQFYGLLTRLVLELGAVFMVGTFFLIMVGLRGAPASVTLVFLFIFYRLAPRILTLQDNFHQSKVLFPYYETWRKRIESAVAHPAHTTGTGQIFFNQDLRLEDVCFTYSGSDRPVIHHLTLTAHKGDCIAIVGPSGSGKSTLMDLVVGLLRPDAGRVLFDGVPLEQLDLEAWRHNLGLVLQESPIFHASVLENITWGMKDIDPIRAEHVARMAHAWEFIMSLPQGLATVVGEKGGRLSGGQRQRLALARALYRKPSILILDEATSSLDSAAEAEVQKALEQIKGTCTILMVAHRLKTVQIADRIFVMANGEIVEQGSWDALMAHPDGLFRQMAFAQGLGQSGVYF